MNLTFFDEALWSLSVAGQILLFAVLIYRRLYNTFPIFTAYLLYSSASDLFAALSYNHLSPDGYFTLYFANNAAEFLLQLGILLEVGWNVLNPVKRSLPKAFPLVLTAIGVGCALVLFFLSIYAKSAMLGRMGNFFVQGNYTFAYARLVIFTAIVFFSQMLGMGWKNHILQLTTGFAGYSIVILMVELAHRFTGLRDRHQYHLLEQLRIIGWCLALGYWAFALAKKEAPRKEFSPKMAQFLVFISGALHETRQTAAKGVRK